MKKIRINADKSYNVIIDSNIENLINILKSELNIKNEKICIITDDNVDKLYGEVTQNSLSKICPTYKYIIKSGETSKNIENYARIIDYLSQNELSRNDIIIALGGGVVGDLAGFCASTYQRGIKYVQIPTTLLAMIDSSVGGKTAINTKIAKNQIGTFYQPSLVFCDISTLNTLPQEQMSSGLGEMIKYCVLDNSIFLDDVYKKEKIKDNIISCIKIKEKYVQNDEKEKGNRQKLNLGHTIGHAIEKKYKYSLSHGQCVAMGLAIICKYSYSNGWLPFEEYISILTTIEKCNLYKKCDYAMDELIDFIKSDKKRNADKINLIIPKAIGNCEIIETDIQNIAKIKTKNIDCSNLKCGLIGEKLSHSISPQIHKKLSNYDYKLYEIDKNNIDNFMKNFELNGANVTIPYKKTVIPYCKISKNAQKIGSVNTIIKLKNGELFGDNTDYYGFSCTVDELGISVADKYVLILGSGGASSTILAYMKNNNAKKIIVISRTGDHNYNNISQHYDLADIIVNTTPVGMYPDIDSCPIDISQFKNISAVIDIIYNPKKTKLLQYATNIGIKNINGMSMLEKQAKMASIIFESVV